MVSLSLSLSLSVSLATAGRSSETRAETISVVSHGRTFPLTCKILTEICKSKDLHMYLKIELYRRKNIPQKSNTNHRSFPSLSCWRLKGPLRVFLALATTELARRGTGQGCCPGDQGGRKGDLTTLFRKKPGLSCTGFFSFRGKEETLDGIPVFLVHLVTAPPQ